MTLSLTPITPTGLDIFANDRDLLRDIFTYIDYVGERSVKRMTRTNDLPRADSVRIAKLLGDPELVQVVQEHGGAAWINFIDDLAYDMDLVDYDHQGEYRGYSSSEPQYSDNYITVKEAEFLKFLTLTPAGQEKQILETLVKFQSAGQPAQNELENYRVLGGLDSMRTYYTHLEKVKFPAVRHFLLKLLENCAPGTWYTTESLIAYLKANHPFFLLPKDLPQKDRWGKPTTRYSGFHEGTDYWQSNASILEEAPDAFERVEGRYVERFLEHIPLVMRFVDVAYDPNSEDKLHPSLGKLKAFCINERFIRLMQGENTNPKVTVQPNFDVIVESDFYPAKVIHQIGALGDLVSNPNNGHGVYVGIFQLKKAAVAAQHARLPDLDVITLLKNISGRELPPNVQIELEEWAGHAEQFVLYEGFALLESVEAQPEAEKYISERITPNLSLIGKTEGLFSRLEVSGLAPIRVWHPNDGFTLVAESASSLFPKEPALSNAPKAARPVKVNRVVTVSYQFPDEESFEVIKKTLAGLRCPFQADANNRTISIQQKEQARFDEALQKLADDFVFEIE